ncbi:P-loop containing nucleoside triphosphate hydrolase protein, partial [Vararia minispora EC-137]
PAPTGSGKTVLFELAMIRAFSSKQQTASGGCKCIYIAPTKALCSERSRDWRTKFEPLGFRCCEMTGDTLSFGKDAWGDAWDAHIMYGEKWDSLTRSWRDHGKILCQVRLFLIDEVHILNELRGSALEVIVSRMKTRATDLRFVAISATVPDISDVASWIGGGNAGESLAQVFKFDDSFRPCKLARFVYGFSRRSDTNEFQFSKMLDSRLFQLLQQHSANKPILIFVATRNGTYHLVVLTCLGVFDTAERLRDDYSKAVESSRTLPWTSPRTIPLILLAIFICIGLVGVGIGAHHAGLSPDDKRAIEELFLNKTLRVVVATSTLAVGVNLPAHIVVIKGVKSYQGGSGWQEYSDLDLLQMMGRAGRPQFDDEGVSIIMCESELTQKYETFTQGRTTLESSLHVNLAEHINSEIGLGTILDMSSARKWLGHSFLYRRIPKNIQRYLEGCESTKTWEERLDVTLERCISELKNAELVKDAEDKGGLCSTEYGDIMSRFYIRQATMALILGLPERASLRDISKYLCVYRLLAPQFPNRISEFKLRQSPRSDASLFAANILQAYKALAEHPEIRYPTKKVEKTSDKLFAALAGISFKEVKIPDSQPAVEVAMVFRQLPRLARAIVEVAMVKRNGFQVKNGLEVMRVFHARAWEDRPSVLGQLQLVGERTCVSYDLHSAASLDEARTELILGSHSIIASRKPGAGFMILKHLAELPRYRLDVQQLSVTCSRGKGPVIVQLRIACGLLGGDNYRSKVKTGRYDNSFVLTLTSDHHFIDFRRLPTKALKEMRDFTIKAKLVKPSQAICVYLSSETIAGVMENVTFKPSVARSEFPVPDTRPHSSLERDLSGVLGDPAFWDPDLDDTTSDEFPVKDLPQLDNGMFDTRAPRAKSEPEVFCESLLGPKLVTPIETRTVLLAAEPRADSYKRLENGKFR